jgi:hypothetical protein
MKGIVLADTRTVEVREVPDAEIKQSTNVLMRGTSTAICGPTFTSLKAECPMAVISLATNLWALRKWERGSLGSQRRSDRGPNSNLLRVLSKLGPRIQCITLTTHSGALVLPTATPTRADCFASHPVQRCA